LENLAKRATPKLSSFCSQFVPSTATAGVPYTGADFCGLLEVIRKHGGTWRDEGFAHNDQRVRGIKK
jgi:hypothetical protein